MSQPKKSPQALSGVFVALYTPFLTNGDGIDVDALKLHINSLIEVGIHGIIPGGSTGEFTTLTMPERKRLIELCVEITAGRVPVIAGIGALAMRDILELAEHAAGAGVIGLMIVPPFYDTVSEIQLRELLATVHQETGLPLLYYHIPSATGLHLCPAQLARLSDVGVQAIKYTAEDATGLTDMLYGYGSASTLVGNDTLIFYGLAAGAPGIVWGLANLVPEMSLELWEAVAVKKDLDHGREIWSKLWPLCKFFESESYAASVKTGMELIGKRTGGMRKPFSLLGPERTQELKRLLQNAGVASISNSS